MLRHKLHKSALKQLISGLEVGEASTLGLMSGCRRQTYYRNHRAWAMVLSYILRENRGGGPLPTVSPFFRQSLRVAE